MTAEGKIKNISLKDLYKLVYNKEFCIDNIQDFKGEIWKEIEGTEGRYFVSNSGRVKSYCRQEAIIVKPQKVKDYLKVQIILNGKKTNKFIHTLVANAFEECGKKVDKDYQVHHKDGNGWNNISSNLIWLPAEQHAKFHK